MASKFVDTLIGSTTKATKTNTTGSNAKNTTPSTITKKTSTTNTGTATPMTQTSTSITPTVVKSSPSTPTMVDPALAKVQADAEAKAVEAAKTKAQTSTVQERADRIAKKVEAKKTEQTTNTKTTTPVTKTTTTPAVTMVDPALAQLQADAAAKAAEAMKIKDRGGTVQEALDKLKKKVDTAKTAQAKTEKTYDTELRGAVDPALVDPNSGVWRDVPAKTETPKTETPTTGNGSGGNTGSGGSTGGITAAVGGQAKPSGPNDVTLTKEIRTNVIPGVVPFLDKDGTQIGYLHNGNEVWDDNGNLIGYYRNGVYDPIKTSTSSTSTTTPGGVSVNTGAAVKAPEAPDLKPLLDQWRTAAEQQQQAQIDYATQQGIDELTRAEEDAQIQFRNAQEQIAAEEMAARDNQALYAEARGDKGGIGAAQYDSIANTAAINRQSVKDAQTKLSTDTARQIADLRAKGEFDKADAVLEIAQTYLSNLMSLEQWAANYGLSAAQFEESIREWEANFEKSVGEMMGEYKGKQTLAARNADRNFELQESNVTGYYGGNPTYAREKANKDTANATVEAYLSAGIMPSDDLLAASDYDASLAQAELMAQKAKKTGSGSGSTTVSADAYEIMKEAGVKTEGEAYNLLRQVGYKDTEAKTYAKYYADDFQAETDKKNSIGNYAQAMAVNLNDDPTTNRQSKLQEIYNAVATGKINEYEADWVAAQIGIG